VARLRIAAAAQSDLRDIRIYSKAAFGAATTSQYLIGLRATFTLLRERAIIGTSEEHLGFAMRSFGYKSHRIYFRSADDEVLIVRILHHARDVPTLMTPER
jgi:toxin ParE1/3/4